MAFTLRCIAMLARFFCFFLFLYSLARFGFGLVRFVFFLAAGVLGSIWFGFVAGAHFFLVVFFCGVVELFLALAL